MTLNPTYYGCKVSQNHTTVLFDFVLTNALLGSTIISQIYECLIYLSYISNVVL